MIDSKPTVQLQMRERQKIIKIPSLFGTGTLLTEIPLLKRKYSGCSFMAAIFVADISHPIEHLFQESFVSNQIFTQAMIPNITKFMREWLKYFGRNARNQTWNGTSIAVTNVTSGCNVAWLLVFLTSKILLGLEVTVQK